jgi:hypothetical protein
MEEATHRLPDGREVSARYDEAEELWIVGLVGQEVDPVSHRAIQEALEVLLEPDEPTKYSSGNWFWNAVDQLGTRETPLGRRAACPCCGYLTFRRGARHSYELCEVCFWEDDGTQFVNPDYGSGANHVSLLEARLNFQRYGASEREFRNSVRPPETGEIP